MLSKYPITAQVIPSDINVAEVRVGFLHFVANVKEYAIFLMDDKGIIRTWNEGAERIKGYSADEICGKHFSVFYPPEASGLCEKLLGVAAREGHIQDEGWRIRKDGSRFWANVTLAALYDEQRHVRGYMKITRDLTERRQYEERLEQGFETVEPKSGEI